MKRFLSLIRAETLMVYNTIGILKTKQAMIDPDTYIFLDAGDLISRGGAVTFNNFEWFYVAVEKYLPDNAALSADIRPFTSYFTENKVFTDTGFSLDL